MNYKIYLSVAIILFQLRGLAQVGISGTVNLNIQNSVTSINQLSYFGNTDFKVSPMFSLCINKAEALHLINVSAQSSNVRILDSGYFNTQFLSFGYSRLIPSITNLGQMSFGYGIDISTSFSQTRSSFITRNTIEEGRFGEIVKFTPYLMSRISLTTPKSGFNKIFDAKIGIDVFGISNGNGVYNPMYFCSIGFGFYKNIKK